MGRLPWSGQLSLSPVFSHSCLLALEGSLGPRVAPGCCWLCFWGQPLTLLDAVTPVTGVQVCCSRAISCPSPCSSVYGVLNLLLGFLTSPFAVRRNACMHTCPLLVVPLFCPEVRYSCVVHDKVVLLKIFSPCMCEVLTTNTGLPGIPAFLFGKA